MLWSLLRCMWLPFFSLVPFLVICWEQEGSFQHQLPAHSCHFHRCSPWKCHSNSSTSLNSHGPHFSTLPFLDCVESVGWRKSEVVLRCHGTCNGHAPVLLTNCMSWLHYCLHLQIFCSLTAFQIAIFKDRFHLLT